MTPGEILDRRPQIVDEIEHRLLNARGKPIPSTPFDACRDLIVVAHRYWDHYRWPGRNGRLAFAQTIFATFVLRHLQAMSLTIWDEGLEGATERLDDIQRLLDRLNESPRPAPFVRSARWLVQTAQGPLARELRPYFDIADRVTRSLTPEQRLEVHAAGAKLAGGHLRSQVRHRAAEAKLPPDDPRVIATARNSNSMDVALLVRDLVPLLEAYKAGRRELADAILQGLSADPELLLARHDLLRPFVAIEYLLEESTSALPKYEALIRELAPALRADAAAIDPSALTYSPFGITYGFCADIVSAFARETLLPDPLPPRVLEDFFETGAGPDDPRTKWFDYSAADAQRVFDRLVAALEARAARPGDRNATGVRDARIVLAKDVAQANAQEHCVTSDAARATATGAIAFPKSQILVDRNEGRYLASGEWDGRWFGLSKMLLTICLAQGKDAVVAEVPAGAVEILNKTCPDLVTDT